MLLDIRRYILRLVDGVSDDALHTVPEGEPNHLLWHLGHLVVTQQLLTYGLSGLPIHAPEALVALCRKGTSPAD
ncbi:MAG: DinB family protein, partial [Bacteroidota bacterium]